MQNKKIGIFNPILSILIPIIIIIILFAAAVNVGIISVGTQEKITYKNSDIYLSKNSSGVSATVIIDFGDGNVLSNNITSKNITVYGFLLDAANIENINVKSTYYKQYDSIFVDSISNYNGGQSNNWWIYYVNNELGHVGADRYIVENNDVIKWKFEKSIY